MRDRPCVGDFLRIDPDRVTALQPDVVVISTCLQAEIARTLVARHLRVVALQPYSLASIYANVRLLGALCERPEAAEGVVRGMEERLEAVRRRIGEGPRPRVLCEEWGEPVVVAIGWIGELIEAAGGVNLFPELAQKIDTPPRTVTWEAVRQRDPEILLLSWCGMRGRVDVNRLGARREGWASVSCARLGLVAVMDDALLMRPGPRIVEGAEQIAALVTRYREKGTVPISGAGDAVE
jgi:iron complex transport system substrate-binding protein